ncbi:MAG: ACP S-malonyltransferase [Myxococcota bacterium]
MLATNGTAVVFPGQGSQCTGMARDFYRELECSRRAFEEASDASGLDLAALCFEPDARLGMTEFTQPALLTAEVAMYRGLSEELGLHATFFGGHSLGEYSALVAAGVLPLATAVQLVRLRGRLMQSVPPLGSGGMIVDGLRAALFGVAELLHPERACHTTCNATGAFHSSDLASLVEALAAQVSCTPRWADNMQSLCAVAEQIYEIGPSRPLSSLFASLGHKAIPITSLRAARKEVFS